MADDTTKQSAQEEPVEHTVPNEKPVEPTIHKTSTSGQLSRTIRQLPAWSWVIIVVFGFFAIFGCVAAGYAAVHAFKDDTNSYGTRTRGNYSLRDDQAGNSNSDFRGGMQRGSGGYGMMGDSNTESSSTRVSGVVTAVDGNTITVAGNGRTTSVKVTDSTTYNGSSKPAAVNDSIVAFGSTSDGVFTATSIRLIRE